MSDDTDQDNSKQANAEKVTRTDVGSSIEVTLKRGEGTRDEDRVKIKAKGETASETIEEFDELLREYEKEYGTRLRNIDPQRESESAQGTDET
ncbi:hypothetical protein [Haloarcula sp. Atlit-7R]|uniref:DUF7389 domain-containing protein n=1 Tax=Haloarcula sp. Atlit-7R TaxID=2282125 RepID=UPI000EF14590|nr:hypothetical protein [Haloarcula sp. Atlit-7R]RLM94403.1 hypothetical protein D3D01_16195 [Haloarcula sp. Atlit-7R]